MLIRTPLRNNGVTYDGGALLDVMSLLGHKEGGMSTYVENIPFPFYYVHAEKEHNQVPIKSNSRSATSK